MLGSSLRNSVSVGFLAFGLAASADLPVGIEELMREPVRAEKAVDHSKCNHSSLKTIAPKVSTTQKPKRTTVAKSEKGFKLFRWLL